MFVVQFLEGQTIPFGQRYRGGGKQVFSDGPQIPLDPAGRPNIGGIPWTVGQAVLSLSAYAYQKAVSLVLATFAGTNPNHVLATAGRLDLPVNLMCTGRLDQAAQLASRNPNTRLVIDHLGLQQPHHPPVPARPWGDLPKLLALAAHDNITVKISGAGTLSHQPFPYKDIWDPLARIFDAFGFGRCMWGTDWTRAVEMLTFRQGVDAFRVTDRLSDTDRSALMGETLQRIYSWDPAKT